MNPHNDGTSLAAGGAVVVSVNYRIGAEGFAHSHGFPDNHGLLDQTGTYFTTELAGDITASMAEEPAAAPTPRTPHRRHSVGPRAGPMGNAGIVRELLR